jgi:hypothetical protein
MPFPYYARLSARDQRIYQASDRVTAVRLPRPALLHSLVAVLREALEREDRRAVEAAAAYLCRGITAMLELAPAEVVVLAARPTARWGELHGLYTRDGRQTPRIQLWMRTARHRRVVKFRTFLRTLLHETGHHLDYEHLKLSDSFHTEGFFRRESSLFHQLLPEPAGASGEDRP